MSMSLELDDHPFLSSFTLEKKRRTNVQSWRFAEEVGTLYCHVAQAFVGAGFKPAPFRYALAVR